VKTYLLDTNILIAWLWPKHIAHKLVGTWFLQYGAKSWSTCPITQSGFVRIISNPKVSAETITPGDALEVLETNMKLPGHRFWPLDAAFGELVSPFKNRILGCRQVTDAYLLGLAIKHNGTLVTLDRGVTSMAGKSYADNILVLEPKKR
jgi:uncharacterized protein